jgi:hypothetical protein
MDNLLEFEEDFQLMRKFDIVTPSESMQSHSSVSMQSFEEVKAPFCTILNNQDSVVSSENPDAFEYQEIQVEDCDSMKQEVINISNVIRENRQTIH